MASRRASQSLHVTPCPGLRSGADPVARWRSSGPPPPAASVGGTRHQERNTTMAQSLMELGELDGSGNARYRVAAGPSGDLVLCHPAQPLAEGLRELEPAEKLRLAALSTERPALVVEATNGPQYILLVDEPVDLNRHVPLGPTDAELLANVQAMAQFGRRDDDYLTLTPWNEEDQVLHFSSEDTSFEDVPLVSLDDNGELVWHRGQTPEQTHLVIRLQLR